ncbi:MAG TPA: DUF4136 domain-containing protein [Leeuwenhoekiella sp.]|nr:DUF4136 domain-containing protein [Leeuwenhoekiella sp.]
MKTLKILAISLIIGVTAASCAVTSSTAIVTDYDRDANFNNYKTFYWSDDFQMKNQKEKEPLFFNTLIKKRLKAAIQDQMENKGYVLDRSKPDLLIDAGVMTQTRDINSGGGYPYYPGYGHGYGHFGYYGYGAYGGYQSSKEHKEGGVVIELIDMSRRQLVWQGFAPDVLHIDTKDKKKEISEAVAKIFSKYRYGNTN